MRKSKEKEILLIIHNVRSAHNVGSMFRTADGAGVNEIILSGYSPLPPKTEALYKTDAQKAFEKTALGAGLTMKWRKVKSLASLFKSLHKEKYTIVALEQSEKSIPYDTFRSKNNVALVVGNEVGGIDKKILAQCDDIIEIPMRGTKNSLNVSVATGIALYELSKEK